MATITLAEFKTRYPEFSDVDTHAIENQIAVFDVQYSGEYAGLRKHLSGLFVAHQITNFNVNQSSAPEQVVTGRAIDGMRWDYADMTTGSKAGAWASTKYGAEFYRLIMMVGRGPITAGATTDLR